LDAGFIQIQSHLTAWVSAVKHAVDAGDGSVGERPVVPAAGSQEVGVEVVDIGSHELGQVEVADVRLEVAVDDGAGVAHCRGRPAGRGGLEPLVEQTRECAGSYPSPTGLGHQLLKLSAGEAIGAVDRLGQPSLPPSIGVDALVDA
jgi:hypothetical protein